MERIWILISLKLSNKASEAELQELQSLLHKNYEAACSLEVMEALWNTPVKENNQYIEQQYKELIQKMEKKGIDTTYFHVEDEHLMTEEENISNEEVFNRYRFFTKKSITILSALIIILGSISLFYYKNNNQPISFAVKSSVITTKDGSKTTIVLPDGTKVWVNAGSKLSYDNNYGNKTRDVYLTGEAYFDVIHNSDKPFIIHTAKMDIKDLGTAFNVRCYPDEKKVETSLIRGSIEISLKDRPKEKIYLKPSEKLTLLNEDNDVEKKVVNKIKKTEDAIVEPLVAIGHLTYLSKDNSVIETSWVENKLVFKGETFENVALKMERWYGVKIVINDNKLKQIHLTGSFNGETIEQALSALQLTTPFRYINNKNYISINNKY